MTTWKMINSAASFGGCWLFAVLDRGIRDWCCWPCRISTWGILFLLLPFLTLGEQLIEQREYLLYYLGAVVAEATI